MSVCSCLFVDRTAKIKHLDDSGRTEVKVFPNDLCDFFIRKLSGTESIYHNRGWPCHTDRVRKLDLAFIRKSCRNNIFCNVTCSVCCGTVHLCTVFSGKSSAAVSCISAVSIHDDLSSCQSAVTVRSADHETACRIDKEFCLIIYHIFWKDHIKHVFLNIRMDLFLCHIRIMLSRKNYCIKTGRFAIFIILNRYLSLSIRTKVRKRAVFSYLCKLEGKFVRQRNRIRHVFLCLIGCVPKHHTLISCTDGFDLIIRHGILFCFQCFVHTHGNICGLLIDRCDHSTGICIKSIFSSRISNLTHGITHDLLDIHISFCGNFSHYKYKTCGGSSFTCNTAHWILLKKCIKNRIGNLVTHFIRMAFSY